MTDERVCSRFRLRGTLYRAWSGMMLLHLMKRITSFSATRRIAAAEVDQTAVEREEKNGEFVVVDAHDLHRGTL